MKGGKGKNIPRGGGKLREDPRSRFTPDVSSKGNRGAQAATARTLRSRTKSLPLAITPSSWSQGPKSSRARRKRGRRKDKLRGSPRSRHLHNPPLGVAAPCPCQARFPIPPALGTPRTLPSWSRRPHRMERAGATPVFHSPVPRPPPPSPTCSPGSSPTRSAPRRSPYRPRSAADVPALARHSDGTPSLDVSGTSATPARESSRPLQRRNPTRSPALTAMISPQAHLPPSGNPTRASQISRRPRPRSSRPIRPGPSDASQPNAGRDSASPSRATQAISRASGRVPEYRMARGGKPEARSGAKPSHEGLEGRRTTSPATGGTPCPAPETQGSTEPRGRRDRTQPNRGRLHHASPSEHPPTGGIPRYWTHIFSVTGTSAPLLSRGEPGGGGGGGGNIL